MAPPLADRTAVQDEHGQYIVYIGKTCDRCGIQLTSRNRFERRLLCFEHRNHRRRSRVQRQVSTRQSLPYFGANPAWAKVHHLLSTWLTDPTDRNAAECLSAAMVDHELIYRFTYYELPPPRTPLETPVENPQPVNPAHLLTRPEFLANGDELGL